MMIGVTTAELSAVLIMFAEIQGGHSTGKTGNLVTKFSRQRKHREFKEFNKTQGMHRECGQGRENE